MSNDKPSTKVILPEFEIITSPLIKISDIRNRRFNLIPKAKLAISKYGKLVKISYM